MNPTSIAHAQYFNWNDEKIYFPLYLEFIHFSIQNIFNSVNAQFLAINAVPFEIKIDSDTLEYERRMKYA